MFTKKFPLALSALCLSITLSTGVALAQSTIIEVQGAPTWASTVACAGDVNGDGEADIAIADDITGTVDLLSGIDGSLIRQLSLTPIGQSWGNLPGYALDHMGDINNDGFDDLLIASVGDALVGLAGAIPQGPGFARVVSGADGSVLYQKAPFDGEQSYGYAAVAINDIDGDSIRDFVVGAPWASTQGKSRNGYISVYSGATGTLLYTRHGLGSDHMAGQSLASAGDLDNDGAGDFVIGSLVASGTAHLLSGANGSQIQGFQAGSSTLSASFGLGYPDIEVASGADVDGDGIHDIVLAKRGDVTNGPNAGAIFVFSGATGSMTHSWLGDPCAGIGAKVELIDVNADSRADIVSASRNDAGHDDDVTVYSATTGQAKFDTDGITNDMTQIAPVGDIDGDGIADFLGGTDPSGLNPGRALVVAGGPWLGDAGKGVITDAQGEISPLLGINGSFGGKARRVDLGVGESFDFEVAQPGNNVSPAGFVVFGQFGAPAESDVVTLPSGWNIGDLAIHPVPLVPWLQPVVFTLASSLGPVAGGEILPASPAPWTHTVDGGIQFEVTFTIQGIVEESAGVLKATNAVIVRVR